MNVHKNKNTPLEIISTRAHYIYTAKSSFSRYVEIIFYISLLEFLQDPSLLYG